MPGAWGPPADLGLNAFADVGRARKASRDPAVAQAARAAAFAGSVRTSLAPLGKDGKPAYTPLATYPQSEERFPKRLAGLAAMLAAGLPIRCATLTAPGAWDTHADQAKELPENLKITADSLFAFQRDLEARGLADRVLTLVWSEFGRRAAENGSGTDHGAAGIGFVIGTPRHRPHDRRVPRPRRRSTRRATCARRPTSAASTPRCAPTGSASIPARCSPAAARCRGRRSCDEARAAPSRSCLRARRAGRRGARARRGCSSRRASSTSRCRARRSSRERRSCRWSTAGRIRTTWRSSGSAATAAARSTRPARASSDQWDGRLWRGRYKLFCTLEGHRALGMRATLRVR